MADRYGWCHTTQCVADWSWGQNANNLFTLLGAVATFAAAFLALRFSQREAKRRLADDLVRAKLAAIANLHLVSDMQSWLDRVRAVMVGHLAVAGAEGATEAVKDVFAFMSTSYGEIGNDALLLLAAQPGDAAFRISRAFTVLGHLREQGVRISNVFHEGVEDVTRAEVIAVIAVLKSASDDLLVASKALHEAAKF